MGTALVSSQTRVEVPFIIVQIGNYTFGHCSVINNKTNKTMKVTYPKYMESLEIIKINGAVNTYQLKIVYPISAGDDPNLLEKVFASVSQDRKIILTYGDWNAPGYIYKNEEAIITQLKSNIDLRGSKITYDVNCTSTSLALKAGTFSFAARTAKPSDVLIELLRDKTYGLTDIFPGMKNTSSPQVLNLLSRTDKKVKLEAKPAITVFDYISYLVSCMVNINETDPQIKKTVYYWSSYDDIGGNFGGAYFKVMPVTAGQKLPDSFDCYEVDIGYPTSSTVIDFQVEDNQAWSILYDYSKKLELPEVTYTLDDAGNIARLNSPALERSSKYLKMTEADKNWWSAMTQFPIKASLTIKGLLRPALLMSYVRVNVYFYGRKHVASGLYMITKQQDSIKSSGYATKLTLLRVAGD